MLSAFSSPTAAFSRFLHFPVLDTVVHAVVGMKPLLLLTVEITGAPGFVIMAAGGRNSTRCHCC